MDRTSTGLGGSVMWEMDSKGETMDQARRLLPEVVQHDAAEQRWLGEHVHSTVHEFLSIAKGDDFR